MRTRRKEFQAPPATPVPSDNQPEIVFHMLVDRIGGDNSKLNQIITQSGAQIQAFAARVEASMWAVCWQN